MLIDADPFARYLEYLDDAIEGAHTETTFDGVQADTFGLAEWCAKHLRDVQAREEHHLAAFEEQMAQLTAWHTAELARLQRGREFWEGRLEGYMRAQHAEDPTLKTVRLPSATLTLRRHPPAWNWPDTPDRREALLQRARSLGLVRTVVSANGPTAGTLREFADAQGMAVTESEDRAGLKKTCSVTTDGRVVDPNGEVVPGVTVETDAPAKFTVKLTGE